MLTHFVHGYLMPKQALACSKNTRLLINIHKYISKKYIQQINYIQTHNHRAHHSTFVIGRNRIHDPCFNNLITTQHNSQQRTNLKCIMPVIKIKIITINNIAQIPFYLILTLLKTLRVSTLPPPGVSAHVFQGLDSSPAQESVGQSHV